MPVRRCRAEAADVFACAGIVTNSLGSMQRPGILAVIGAVMTRDQGEGETEEKGGSRKTCKTDRIC